mmetsp:Transcript_9700/g.16641  ORF Transcript_9700/g.16641 Transcript_9700/m.16641 type:complete len:257 (+) Transcript_9700:907-1677(+)
MARLVVGDELALGLGHHCALLLGARDDTLQGVGDLILGDLLEVTAGGHDGSLVHEVLQIGTAEARGTARDLLEVHVTAEGLAARVHLQDLDAPLHVGTVHRHLAIEATGAEERLVEHVGPVGRREHDHARVALETVHLRQKLVDRLLTLVVSAAHTGATLATDGVDFVDEHDAGRLRLCLLEQIAHAGGTHADEELNELGRGAREERHARLAGHSLGDECLSGTGGAHEQATAGDLGSELGVLVRVLEEVDHLLEL